ncbi:hypothetical protein [Flavihumibacter petaseus]|uniref:Uncharacterized protein n=1 Tax=Flavihumibacter petaseus NBRC 106054 TaxID=1220578 RepID=A0A0E9MY18_9BACT|nr:hypothetical protein [Flavihumibacter petaseus]GAO42020.1 hypothetical protein FPE01S_01_10330 [Flavihumibacter petaseus NBRC 106054]
MHHIKLRIAAMIVWGSLIFLSLNAKAQLHAPASVAAEAQIAFDHFPELKNVPVTIRVKHSYCTGKTRPTFISCFLPRNKRSYVITISDHTIDTLTPLLFENLPEPARIGLIGHEISHVADFVQQSTAKSWATAAGHLSRHYMDSLEYHTDLICIRHGLGANLEAWSSYIRATMHTRYWRGADFVIKGDDHYERYMNPDTIESYMTP